MKIFIKVMLVTVVFSVAIRILFEQIPTNIITTDFYAGWLGCMVWGYTYQYLDKQSQERLYKKGIDFI